MEYYWEAETPSIQWKDTSRNELLGPAWLNTWNYIQHKKGKIFFLNWKLFLDSAGGGGYLFLFGGSVCLFNYSNKWNSNLLTSNVDVQLSSIF